MSDLTLSRNLKKGSRGNAVRLIQEWLVLHDNNIAVDGDFGPVTDLAVRRFQGKKGLTDNGIVDQKTFKELISPMTRAMEEIEPTSQRLGSLVVAYAKQHLREHPREVGGQNMGPWVRLYMKGNQGSDWPWCAGFASFVLTQACNTLGVQIPIKTSFSCDSLAASAKQNGLFVKESEVGSDENPEVGKGWLFLQRRTPTDWVHTGIVQTDRSDVFETIEGNTNDEGSREGYEVCQRIRGFDKKDFILIA